MFIASASLIFSHVWCELCSMHTDMPGVTLHKCIVPVLNAEKDATQKRICLSNSLFGNSIKGPTSANV